MILLLISVGFLIAGIIIYSVGKMKNKTCPMVIGFILNSIFLLTCIAHIGVFTGYQSTTGLREDIVFNLDRAYELNLNKYSNLQYYNEYYEQAVDYNETLDNRVRLRQNPWTSWFIDPRLESNYNDLKIDLDKYSIEIYKNMNEDLKVE
jgi:ABC-type transport system involved in multi-copper enzyme maturation permease subunit